MKQIIISLIILFVGVEIVLSETPSGNIPPTFFGMHTGNTNHWPTVTFGALGKGRVVNWCYSEPSKGLSNWANLDAWVNIAEKYNLSYFFSNDGIPTWAVNDQRTCKDYGYAVKCSGMVRDIREWDNFVTELVKRYRGKLIYELWNEPDCNFFEYQRSPALSISDLVTITTHMHDIIRSLDPGATIISPSASCKNSADYMDKYWAAGGVKDIDVVSIHGYPDYKAMNNAESIYPQRIKEIRDVMKKHGIDKPIWDTEGSWGDQSKGAIIDQDKQAAFVAQSYLLHWSYGVERFYWYAWDGGDWGPLWDPINGVSPGAKAYQEVYNWMVGAKMSVPCSMDSNNTWTCGLSRSRDYKALAIWNSSTTLSYTPSSTYEQYRDLCGGKHTIQGPIQISERPVLLETSTSMVPPCNLRIQE
jgi:hypothetical protein